MKKTAILSTLLLSIGASAQAQDTTYDWTGGLPGYSGTIVLDSPSSAGGNLGDIVSMDITAPGYGSTQVLVDLGFLDGQFTWSATHITDMEYVNGLDQGPFNAYFDIEASAPGDYGRSDVGVSGDLGDVNDFSGSWEARASADVPDPMSTLPVLFFLFGSLIAGRQLLNKSYFQH